MDPGERRRATPGAERLRRARAKGLAAANLAALAILLFLVFAPSQPRAGAERPDPTAGAVLTASRQPDELVAPHAAPPAPPPPRSVDARLQERVRAIAARWIEEARKKSGGALRAGQVTVAVHVREHGTPGDLVAIQADRSLRPASNMKLVTSAAALVLLGPEWSFVTGFDTDAALRDGRLEGDLVVRAGGDPLYDTEADGEVARLLAPAVEALRAAGVRTVAGDLVLDEGSYLAPGPGPGWPDAGQYWAEHCARCAGFSVNAGCLTAVVEAGSPGGSARVRVLPRGHGLELHGTVTTGRAKSRLDVAVGAQPPRVTVRGSLPADVPRWSARFAHPDPVELFGACLRAALAAGGVRVEGGVVRARGASGARRLAELRSPLLDALVPINTHSNNAVSDQLFLALGASAGAAGDREGGARATRRALERLGLDPAGLVQVDGSGLSREDRVTARQVSALIEAVLALGGETAQAFLDSLAVAGETGTLERRMLDGPARTRLRAKTGWISGTSALSGVAQTLAGRRLVFSILVEYPRLGGLNTSAWKPMQDAICAELVSWDG